MKFSSLHHPMWYSMFYFHYLLHSSQVPFQILLPSPSCVAAHWCLRVPAIPKIMEWQKMGTSICSSCHCWCSIFTWLEGSKELSKQRRQKCFDAFHKEVINNHIKHSDSILHHHSHLQTNVYSDGHKQCINMYLFKTSVWIYYISWKYFLLELVSHRVVSTYHDFFQELYFFLTGCCSPTVSAGHALTRNRNSLN